MIQGLDEDSIKKQITLPHEFTLEIFKNISSTSEYLKSKFFAADKILIALADTQSSGYGRGGEWYSPANTNIYLSILLPFKKNIAELMGLSLVVGLVVSQETNDIISAYTDKKCGIKWPNDIWWNERKLAGVLLETGKMRDNILPVIIGIGLNVNMMEAKLDQDWTSLKNICGVDFDRNKIAGSLVNEIIKKTSEFALHGFTGFREEWRKYDLLFKKNICFTSSGKSICGAALGVDAHGRLLVQEDNGGVLVVSSAENIRYTFH